MSKTVFHVLSDETLCNLLGCIQAEQYRFSLVHLRKIIVYSISSSVISDLRVGGELVVIGTSKIHTEHLGVSSEKLESINSNKFND